MTSGGLIAVDLRSIRTRFTADILHVVTSVGSRDTNYGALEGQLRAFVELTTLVGVSFAGNAV
jgi:hypothetical protein